jgi:uncharacterized protein (DUF433 family)
MITAPTEDQLLAMHTAPDPDRGGKAYARVKPSGIPIWALIGALPGAGNEPREVARIYDISEAEMEAALVYYRRHRKYIDAVLLLNEDAFESDS